MKQLVVTIIMALLVVGCEPTKSDLVLIQAAGKGNIEAVKQAIADGANVNASDTDWMTPLHYAIIGGTKEQLKEDLGGLLVRTGHKDVAELLISNGAYVNAKNLHGQTPLDLSYKGENQTDLADLLLSHGGKYGMEKRMEETNKADVNASSGKEELSNYLNSNEIEKIANFHWHDSHLKYYSKNIYDAIEDQNDSETEYYTQKFTDELNSTHSKLIIKYGKKNSDAIAQKWIEYYKNSLRLP